MAPAEVNPQLLSWLWAWSEEESISLTGVRVNCQRPSHSVVLRSSAVEQN